MKSPASSQHEAENHPSARAPTETTSRPALMRSPPDRLSDISQSLNDRRQSQSAASSRADQQRPAIATTASESSGMDQKARIEASGVDGERLADLRDAMNARLLVQQRMRRSYGSPKSDAAAARVPGIQEEDTQSPQSINAMLARTDSHDSTESASTVRAGKVTSAGGNAPLRTPSYPFPYVPGAPKTWSPQLHQPFTTLSPTATSEGTLGYQSADEPNMMPPGGGTPAAHNRAFLPSGGTHDGQQDPRFPTPNLYDLVLQINAEPGLEQWWATVTNLMHDHFKAERATLVVPRDSSEIENVPWGQKASFSMNGPEEFVPHRTLLKQIFEAADGPQQHGARPEVSSRKSSGDDRNTQKLHRQRLRPRLELRHSYAGHGTETKETAEGARPAGPQRTATHAAGMTPTLSSRRAIPQRFDSNSTQAQSSVGNLDFSSVAGTLDAGPYAEVFPLLRNLDHEVRPLIESAGVGRILERGQIVTVTRDYFPSNRDADTGFDPQHAYPNLSGPTPDITPRPSVSSVFGEYSFGSASDSQSSSQKDYEEYEQYPASPWSQSPAPSPAIRANEDVNPFFSSQEQHVEDSFEPGASPPDYSQQPQVEAIGTDHASTIIHIPLVHPLISQSKRPINTRGGSEETPRRRSTLEPEQKFPMAILSILTPTMPYPPNLTQTLSLLGPHLATSLATSQQFSSTRPQAVTIRYRSIGGGETDSRAPMTVVPTSLEDIMNAEVEKPLGSFSASGTSPSEHSARSPYSTTSSIVGTPGWDPATHGWTTTKSAAGTPAMTGSEIVDSYFEAKKRSGKRSMSGTSSQTQTTPARSTRRISGSDRKQGVQKASPADDIGKALRLDQKSKLEVPSNDERPAGKDPSPPPSPLPHSSQRRASRQSIALKEEPALEIQHSQLHSYGADVQTSFGGLPSTTHAELPTPAAFGHARKPSYSDRMPPPSERLLRTIIDSVPVQIFTAEPETGRLTWINSKFMVYRGQEAEEVLSDPWQAIHPDDRDEFMSTWHRSLRTAQHLQQRVRLKRFDRHYRWFYVRAAPLLDKKQKIVHWIGTMMDFHEQNLAQETAAKQQETAASEAKYRALANSSPQIVFAANKTKGITFCNTQWVHFSGQSETQARGVGFMDHVHPDDLVKCKLPTFEEGSNIPKGVPTSVPPELNRSVSGSAESSSGSSETERVAVSPAASPLTTHMPQRKLSELASTGILKVSRDADGRPSYSTEVRLKSKDGEYKWHLVRVLLAEPLIQKDQEEETWYGTCTDISDHKALERDLKETMDEKSRFLSNMSHEIRTPLNGITGMVNFLIDSNLTAEQMEHVNIIRASTEGLRGLINDILDLSKAEAGMIQLNMDWLYVRALIEEVNDLTSAMAIDKGLELNYLVEENVPTQIKGDRFRIRQILLNIIGNAIKFTQKGEVFIHCSTYLSDDYELEDNELYIKFEVIDTGRGFTEEEAEHLFKRFSQIDGSSTRQHGGSGLGLVISRQLAQLHGGDIRAKGISGQGSTFLCLIKATLPSDVDQPPTPLLTPGGVNIPILPVPTGPGVTSLNASTLPKSTLKFSMEQTQSPSPYATSPDVGRESPSVSSGGSDRSLLSTTRTSSLHSERSSASSFIHETATAGPPMKLALPHSANVHKSAPSESKLSRSSTAESMSGVTRPPNVGKGSSSSIASAGSNTAPPMYSILVVCPLKYSREATVQHIDKTLPKNVPHQITAKQHFSECQEMLKGDDPVIFTHIVAVLHDVAEITALMDQVLTSQVHQSTSIVIITDLAQRKSIMEHAPKYDYDSLAAERRLIFVFKPLKPSRFAMIFDPQKEREMSLDRNQDSAQQVALTQKQVFEEVAKRLGNRDKRVLLVEDNRTNQLVVLKFLAKVSINADTAMDGIECTEKIFSKPFGYYSVVLCDLHMPNKDGYQTCEEIRKWENEHRYPHVPIVALSANVLGDVHEKCVTSGFNSYLTKPVDFKELGAVLMTFMDPIDPTKAPEFMKMKMKRRKGV